MTVITPFILVTLSAALPLDPDFPRQWSLQNVGQEVNGVSGTPGADIRALEAWSVHAGVRPVVVAIIGSGVNPHMEFADRLLPGYVTSLAGGDPYSTLDFNQNGTRAAGIVAAHRDDVGIAGIHDGALILPVRVASSANLQPESVAEGLTWAIDHGAEIALVLVQLYSTNPAIAQAVDYATQNNVLVIAPAGHQSTTVVAFPASLPDVLAVAATTRADAKAAFSNEGPEINLAAPGEWIWSTLGESSFGYHHEGDTFLAAAHVAGVAALMLSYSPALSAGELREILQQTADDLGAFGTDAIFGYGRLNAEEAMLATPRPLLHVEPVTPPPASLRPLQDISFPVRISNGTGILNPTSPEIVYRTSPGPFTNSIRLTWLADNLYSATIPAAPCGTTIEFYLIAGTLAGLTVTEPPHAPLDLYAATVDSVVTIFHDDFETDRGWQATAGLPATGLWIRDEPVGTLSGNTQVQPEYDRSPNEGARCFFTGQHPIGSPIGSNDVDGGPLILTSPIIEIGDHENVAIEFAAWVYSVSGITDQLIVELSTDGGNSWVNSLTIPHSGTWTWYSLPIGSFPSLSGTSVQARFTISDIPVDSLTEAAIDEFRVISHSCMPLQGDINFDGFVNLRDLGGLVNCLLGPASIRVSECAMSDFNNDVRVDLRDTAILLRNARNP